jgi:hypothetical protein
MHQWQLSHLNSHPATALMINLPDSEYFSSYRLNISMHDQRKNTANSRLSGIQASRILKKLAKFSRKILIKL